MCTDTITEGTSSVSALSISDIVLEYRPNATIGDMENLDFLSDVAALIYDDCYQAHMDAPNCDEAMRLWDNYQHLTEYIESNRPVKAGDDDLPFE